MSCYIIKSFPNPSKEKQLTLLAIHSTGCISPVVKYFRIFGSDCYILRDRENLENLIQRVTRDIF